MNELPLLPSSYILGPICNFPGIKKREEKLIGDWFVKTMGEEAAHASMVISLSLELCPTCPKAVLYPSQ